MPYERVLGLNRLPQDACGRRFNLPFAMKAPSILFAILSLAAATHAVAATTTPPKSPGSQVTVFVDGKVDRSVFFTDGVRLTPFSSLVETPYGKSCKDGKGVGGTLETGFRGNVQVVDRKASGEVLVDYELNYSKLEVLEPFTSGECTVQLPRTREFGVHSRAWVKPGQSLTVFGREGDAGSRIVLQRPI